MTATRPGPEALREAIVQALKEAAEEEARVWTSNERPVRGTWGDRILAAFARYGIHAALTGPDDILDQVAGLTAGAGTIARDENGEGLQLRRALEWVLSNTQDHVIAQFVFAALAASPSTEAEGLDATHPEATCQRCGRSNAWSWSAPSPLWNAVMRDPATGHDRYGIVCPVCFSQLVEEARIGGGPFDGRLRLHWRLDPDDLDVASLWQDPDGRVWDPKSWLWVEPPLEPR